MKISEEKEREIRVWVKNHIETTETYQAIMTGYNPSVEIFQGYLCEIVEQYFDFNQKKEEIPIAWIKNCPTKIFAWLKKIMIDCNETIPQGMLIDVSEDSQIWLCTWYDKGRSDELRKAIEEYFEMTMTAEEAKRMKWQISHGCFVLHSEQDVMSLRDNLKNSYFHREKSAM